MIDGYAAGTALLIGSFAGFAAGLFGIGGGVVLVPLLSDILLPWLNTPGEVVEQLARGTSVAVTLFASISSAHRHQTKKNVIWKAVPFLASGSVLSAWGGAALAAYLPGGILRRVLGVVMILAASRMFFALHGSSRQTEALSRFRLFVVGLVGGLVASLCGIGGGVVFVPAMVLLLGISVKRVAGTSSAAIVFTAASAALGYAYQGWSNPLLPPGTLGYVHWILAIPLILSSMVFSQIGAAVNSRINAVPLRRLFGGLLGVVGVRMLVS